MARIPLVAEDDASPEVRALFEDVKQTRGRVLNIHRGVANHPRALRAVLDLISSTYRSGSLDPRYGELAYLYTSTLNRCHY